MLFSLLSHYWTVVRPTPQIMICISPPAPSTTTTTTTLPLAHRLYCNKKRNIGQAAAGEYIHLQWKQSREDSGSLCSSNYSSCKTSSTRTLSRTSSKSSITSLDTNCLVEDMFRSIEVWIAAHRIGQEVKRIEDSEDILENDDSDDDLSWQVTLRPRYRYRLCDSLWV